MHLHRVTGVSDEWLPLSALAEFAFDVRVTTYFLLDPVFLQGVDAAGFLKRVKAAVKHQPHTHVLVTRTQPTLSADEQDRWGPSRGWGERGQGCLSVAVSIVLCLRDLWTLCRAVPQGGARPPLQAPRCGVPGERKSQEPVGLIVWAAQSCISISMLSAETEPQRSFFCFDFCFFPKVSSLEFSRFVETWKFVGS